MQLNLGEKWCSPVDQWGLKEQYCHGQQGMEL